jgi:hypothetical protein
MTTVLSDRPAQVIHEQGRCYISVPWARADELHARVRRLGYDSTLCLDPRERTARIELPPDADPEAALAVLEGKASVPSAVPR